MISIKETEKMLEELANELPKEFYKELSGGIMLLPEMKKNTDHNTDNLYTLGEYHKNANMGRFITIYYGSFTHIYGHLPPGQFKIMLRKTLRHEFRHHIESLAGERGLEIEDARKIAEYKRKLKGQVE